MVRVCILYVYMYDDTAVPMKEHETATTAVVYQFNPQSKMVGGEEKQRLLDITVIPSLLYIYHIIYDAPPLRTQSKFFPTILRHPPCLACKLEGGEGVVTPALHL